MLSICRGLDSSSPWLPGSPGPNACTCKSWSPLHAANGRFNSFRPEDGENKQLIFFLEAQ
jgi:hypothetical protein